MNLEDEFEKFMEHKKKGEKYFPKLELEQIESTVDLKSEFEGVIVPINPPIDCEVLFASS